MMCMTMYFRRVPCVWSHDPVFSGAAAWFVAVYFLTSPSTAAGLGYGRPYELILPCELRLSRCRLCLVGPALFCTDLSSVVGVYCR